MDANHVTFASFCNAFTVARTKTATLNLRIDPDVKDAIRRAAEREHRSVANMVEMLIRRHSAEAGIPIPDRPDSRSQKGG